MFSQYLPFMNMLVGSECSKAMSNTRTPPTHKGLGQEHVIKYI